MNGKRPWAEARRRGRTPAYLAVLVPLGLLGIGAVAGPALASTALPTGCAQSGSTVTCTWALTDGTFTVPAGVSQVTVTADGAAGAPNNALVPGGNGGQVDATLTGLTAGQTLAVSLGDNLGFTGHGGGGSSTGGGLYGGGYGGAGGGYSEVTLNGAPQVLAGGGGGAGADGGQIYSSAVVGGASGGGGGNPAAAGGTGSGLTDPFDIYLLGGPGGNGAVGSTPGTAGYYGPETGVGIPCTYVALSPGNDGIPLHGGDGAGGGGGGGGGYAGGGGGGGGAADVDCAVAGGGGGGGGSSYAAPTATNVSFSTGVWTAGRGQVTISYSSAPATATTVTSSANPSVAGQQVSYTATVTPLPDGGTVSFSDGQGAICTAVPVDTTTGTATCQDSYPNVGTRSVTADYSGDPNFQSSTSAALAQQVNQAQTSTTVASSANPSLPSQQVTFTATVAATAPGAGTPTGTVTFTNGPTVLGTSTLTTVGGRAQATFSTAKLTAGAHSITAAYGGDADFQPGTSAALSQEVGQSTTSTTLASSANPSTPGQSVTFTATVAATGAGTPTGTITFADGGTVLGTGTLTTAGGQAQATFSTAALTAGTHWITATYGGDPTFQGSASAALAQNVDTSLSRYLTSTGSYDLANANLAGAYLAGADLAGVDISSANLAGANLTGANLTGANLSSANLKNANLTGADLTGANLTATNFTGANLSGANLTNADLTRTNFKAATGMTSAILTGATWDATNCPDNTSSTDDGGTCLNNLTP